MKKYIHPNAWSIIEKGFNPDCVCSSESLFSLGNGAMGQRANFEETYTGKTFQGSYVAGVYYPDKTKVGWWKNGYPEYFAKVLNAPNWIGIQVLIDGEELDLNRCAVYDFQRELSMKEGVYYRKFRAVLLSGAEISVEVTRFLSLEEPHLGVIHYQIIPLNRDMTISFSPYVDAGVKNNDSNWDEFFWKILHKHDQNNCAWIHSQTQKTHFNVHTFMINRLSINDKPIEKLSSTQTEHQITHHFVAKVKKKQRVVMYKIGGYIRSDAECSVQQCVEKYATYTYETLLEKQRKSWEEIWQMSDIVIEGDILAQQAIRFTIFHLNQTYTGKDTSLNIGPKGFTGEKYGGSTYWDTEAYCLPFYMATKHQNVARGLLEYRYKHLPKAIENASKLGFSSGAALYPMVTMNGEECHNEWEITFEEIHRNGAILFAIYNYTRYTGDFSYITEKGIEVMIAVSRFWSERANFSSEKQKYVILGVTGPNEYENNVNNNWYTNYLASWCLSFTKQSLKCIKEEYPNRYDTLVHYLNFSQDELQLWDDIIERMYFPYSELHGVFLQQDGFLDKDLTPASSIPEDQKPINQHWSWDRILRSPYIKQADTLQGFYFFEEDFSQQQIERHFRFYEPFTVHESSLSPCVHSILACKIGDIQKAYDLYMRTSRLDLDDYNKEVSEGLHITSMAGAWLSIVEGFAGMRVKNNTLYFSPKLPAHWNRLSFNINIRGEKLKVEITQEQTQVLGNFPLPVVICK